MPERISRVLDSFLASNDLRVLVLKGDWGVGKTYFWEHYIAAKLREGAIQQPAYAYISLFGKGGLKDVKSTVFESAANIGMATTSGETAMRSRHTRARHRIQVVWHCMWAKSIRVGKWVFRKGTTVAPHIPYGKQVAELIRAAEYKLVNNYLICFDDLERKSEALPVRDLMGLVDELVVRKACKVILVFNDKSFEQKEEREAFNRYREKVVDIEVQYSPSISDNLSLLFSTDDALYPTLLRAFTALSVRNIRVFKKVRLAIDAVSTFAKRHGVTIHPTIREDMAVHLAVLCWGYYCTADALPIGFLKEQLRTGSWMVSLLSEKKKELTSATDQRWNAIATQLGLSTCDYIEEVSELVETGFIPEDAFQRVLTSLNQQAEANEASASLHRAWNLYGESFADNEKEFLDEVAKACQEGLKHLGLGDFSHAVDLLEHFGRNADSLIADYCFARRDQLTDPGHRESIFEREIHNQTLRDKIKDLRSTASRKLTLDSVTSKIVNDRGWSPEDIDFLKSLTVDDIYRWMMTPPPDMVTKVRSGLLMFRGLAASSPDDNAKYRAISDNTEAALRRIAKESRLNNMRVNKIYGVSIDD